MSDNNVEIQIETIEEGKVNETPGFYTSVVNNPIKEITGKNKKIYSDYIVLKNFTDYTVAVPESSGGNLGRATLTGSHGIRSGIPFCFAYILQVNTTNLGVPVEVTSFSETPVQSSAVNFSNLYVGDSTYRLEAYNLNSGLGTQTFKIRVFHYQLKLK